MALISVFTDQMRPDKAREYQELVAELAAEARKKQEPWHWTSYQVGFGPLGRIYHVSQHPDHADIEKQGDAEALFTRVLGEKRGPKLLEDAQDCLVSTERALGIQRPDLSYPQEPAESIAQASSLALIRARPGRQQAVEKLLRQMAEAIPKTGEPGRIDVAQALTGDMLLYWIVRPLESLADLDRQSIGRDLLIKALGQSEGERIFQSGLENVDQLQREITFYREDLSNPPR